MNIQRILIAALASVTLLQISVPADASEVVKLARLVLTGKRTVADTPREPATSSSSGSNAEKTSQSPSTGEGSGSSTPELGSSSNSGSLTGGHGSHIFLRAF